MTIESSGEGQGRHGTVVFRGSFHRLRRGRRYDLERGPVPKPGESGGIGKWAVTGGEVRPANVAVLLAFAHHVQRLIDAGRITDRAEVAQRLHWTRARVSQVMGLLLLAPDIEDEVLFPDAGTGVTERSLRGVVRCEDWREQRAEWGGIGTR